MFVKLAWQQTPSKMMKEVHVLCMLHCTEIHNSEKIPFEMRDGDQSNPKVLLCPFEKLLLAVLFWSPSKQENLPLGLELGSEEAGPMGIFYTHVRPDKCHAPRTRSNIVPVYTVFVNISFLFFFTQQ